MSKETFAGEPLDPHAAADEIDRLRGEVERLTREDNAAMRVFARYNELEAERDAAIARAEAAERERDEAIARGDRWMDRHRDASRLLEAERNAALDARDESIGHLHEAALRLRDAEAKVAKLREALTPFVDAYENTIACDDDKWRDKDSLWESAAAMALCAGDLRRARTALQETEQ